MDYDDYLLNNNSKIDDELKNEPINEEKNTGNGFKILIIIILIAVLLFLIIWLLNHNKKGSEPVLTINEQEITMNVGEEHQIDYKFNNGGNKNVNLTWSSTDENILVVDNKGIVFALLEGTGTVKATYKYKNKENTKEILVIINKEEIVEPIVVTPEFDYNVSVKDGEWSSNDVIIDLNSDNREEIDIKYSINCKGDKCDEIVVEGNRIIISKEGKNTIYVTATGPDGNSITKEIKVNIDKTKPTCEVSLNGKEINVKSNDNASGIKYIGTNSNYSGTNVSQEVVSSGKKIYYVMDNAGNKNSCSANIIKNDTNVCSDGYTLNANNKCEKLEGSPVIKNGSWYVSKTEWGRVDNTIKAVDNCAKARSDWTLCTITTVYTSMPACSSAGTVPCYKKITKLRSSTKVCPTGTLVGTNCYSYSDPVIKDEYYVEKGA